MPAADPFDGSHEEALSYLHGVAVDNQPTAIETGPVMAPVALVGRVSDKDNQDPTLSIPRPLARCREALPPYCVIVAAEWLWRRNHHQERKNRLAELGKTSAAERRARHGHITRQPARELEPHLMKETEGAHRPAGRRHTTWQTQSSGLS